PLPPWLQFDGSTGRFTGTPPAGSPPALDVKLTARDDRGNTASTQFAVQIADGNAAPRQETGSPATNAAPGAGPGTGTSNSGAAGAGSAAGAAQPAPSPAPAPASASAGNEPSSPAPTASELVSRPATGDAPAGARGLSLAIRATDQQTAVGRDFSFQLPQGMFHHADADMPVSIEARLASGEALPGWLKFDPASGRFSGRPPAGVEGDLDIRVTARDATGKEVSAQFRLSIADMEHTEPRTQDAPERDDAPAGSPDADEQSLAARQTQRGGVAGRPALAEQMDKLGRAAALQRDQQKLVASLQRVATTRRGAV
ncbi:MAG: putative Ig domain-containing protein, partial [Rhodocyclaceae bacterium]|nr:putative Ig domain-containing protein [Rhodocyclaceae bacterium]